MCISIPGETLVYHCAPSIVWTRDLDHTRLIDGDRGISWMLQGVEAAIWDWLVLAYPYQKVMALLSALSGVPPEEARHILLPVLENWRRAGIVEASRGTESGEPGDQHSL